MIETAGISKDVPLGDSFVAEEKWNIIENNRKVKIQIDCFVRWKKPSWGFKGKQAQNLSQTECLTHA
jgi:hypothetical protein